VLLLLLAGGGDRVDARAGGGHTYSGGHSSGSSGSHSSGSSSGRSSTPIFLGGRSGGGGGSIGGCGCGCFLLIILVIIVVLIILSRKGLLPSLTPSSSSPSPPPPPPAPAPVDLDAIRQLDPEFSVVLFEDFAYALYAKAHEARNNRNDLDALAPYLSPAVRADLERRPPVGAPVEGVIVGAMRVTYLALPPPQPPAGAPAQVYVVLEFESNMTVGAPGAQATQYVRERWHLMRDAGVRTKPPEAVRSFHCPNCGAPFGPEGGDRCQYCGEVVSGGRFDWSVQTLELLELEDRPPSLTGTAEEEGGDQPTIVHPAAAERRAELLRDDPAASDEALGARLRLIYDELNAGWAALDLTRVRPFVSDSLFDYLQYWINAYHHQGLRNVLEGMQLTRWTLVKVVRDKHFDSITWRIWGTGHDSTIRVSDGAVVGGNPRANRDYSEYWTLIRGAAVRGAPRTDKSCPNCGAPLEVNMAGRCEHCDAKVTSGDFDWVLSKIEQDESYSG
jgi:predicted lipid-binding transport protein (Tim44 family)